MYSIRSRSAPAHAAAARLYGTTVLLATLLGLAACKPGETDQMASAVAPGDMQFRVAGSVQSEQLDEISGLHASRRHAGVLWVHNDDGLPRVHAMGEDGRDLGYFDIENAVNVDWEDMTLIPAAVAGTARDLLVLADIGDNSAKRSRVWLYLVEEPGPGPDGRFSGSYPAHHWVSLAYPDGPRDAESIAWDSFNEQLLILSKRDKPARLYFTDIYPLLAQGEITLDFAGEVRSLRPPTPADRQVFGDRTPWVAQATGMDLSPDGLHAAIISYRSLYLYQRPPQGEWLETLNSEPLEIIGPRGDSEEAVGYGAEPGQIWVSSEGLGAPLIEFRSGAPAQQ